MRSTLIIVLLLCMLSVAKAQDTPEEKAFVKSLVEAEYGGDMQAVSNINLEEIPYSVSLGDEMDKYSVYFHIIAHEDLNDDGIDDYLIYRMSEGMLGGNANTNSQYIYYIMSDDREIYRAYEILGYAPFSYNIVEEAKYNNKRFIIDIRQNFRTYYNNGEELETAGLSFIYKDGNLYEESYLSGCEMAKMSDKRIFRTELEGVERELNIDMHNYTETSLEKYASEEMTLNAWLSGCDNLTLGFSATVKLHDKVKPTNTLYKKTMIDFLRFLVDNTRYKTVMSKVLENYQILPDSSNADADIKFDQTWFCRIPSLDYNAQTNSLRIFMVIENRLNINQEDNWDITIRRKD